MRIFLGFGRPVPLALSVVASVALGACAASVGDGGGSSGGGGQGNGGESANGTGGAANGGASGQAGAVGKGGSGIGGAGGAAGKGGSSGNGGANQTGGASTGGASGSSSGGAGGQAGGAGMGVPTIVAVGWGGLRVRSRDLGITWTDRVAEGDGYDKIHLLDGVTWGKGTFVATGHNPLIYTSPDGKTWTARQHPCQDIHAVTFGNGLFAGCAYGGCVIKSSDGATWTQSGTVKHAPLAGSNDPPTLRTIVFGNGQFATASDALVAYVSTDDTATWNVLPGLMTDNVGFCGGAFKVGSACQPAQGLGFYWRSGSTGSIDAGGHGTIERSTDGKTWKTVFVDTGSVLVTSFAFGESTM